MRPGMTGWRARRRRRLVSTAAAVAPPQRYVVLAVARTGAMASVEPMAAVLGLAVALGPALLLLLPLELLVITRFVRQGTYLDAETLTLCAPFATRRVARADVHRLAIEDVRPGRAGDRWRVAVAILRDGRRVRLPGLSSSRVAPGEPDATVRALAAAAGLELAPPARPSADLAPVRAEALGAIRRGPRHRCLKLAFADAWDRTLLSHIKLLMSRSGT